MKLTDLNPDTVALDVARAALDHVSTLLIHLSPMGDVRTAGIALDELQSCELYLSTRRLAAYAIARAPLDAPVQEYLISLVPCVAAALGEGTREVDGLGADADPSTPLGLVICAALAREALDAGRNLTTAQLAVLGGVSQQYVRRLLSSGELDGWIGPRGHGGGHEITAEAARAWLDARVARALRDAPVDDEPSGAAGATHQIPSTPNTSRSTFGSASCSAHRSVRECSWSPSPPTR